MSPPLYYVYFIGGDAPSVLLNFPYPLDLMLPGGEGEKPDTSPLGVCRSSPFPSGLRNLILVFLFWGLVGGGGNPIRALEMSNLKFGGAVKSIQLDNSISKYMKTKCMRNT